MKQKTRDKALNKTKAADKAKLTGDVTDKGRSADKTPEKAKALDKATEKATEKAAADKSKEKPKQREVERPRRFATIARFIRDTRLELKKVVWPTRQTAIHLTVIVTAVSVAVGAFLGLTDLLFERLFELILGAG